MWHVRRDHARPDAALTDYLPGEIMALEIHNFMNHKHLRSWVPPRLDLHLSFSVHERCPLFCAIALGLAVGPQELGAGLKIGSFVRRGECWGYIKLTLRGEIENEEITIMRKFDIHSNSVWMLDGVMVTEESISATIKKFDLQVKVVAQEHLSTVEIFQLLRSTKEGLSSKMAYERLNIVGQNKPCQRKASIAVKSLKYICNSYSFLMIMTTLQILFGTQLSSFWPEVLGILVLLLVGSAIRFFVKNNYNIITESIVINAARKSWVLRDGLWCEVETVNLVPGDIICIKSGDVIPADALLFNNNSALVDQSALTGESVPIVKNPGDELYYGSISKEGDIEAVVTATGNLTFYGTSSQDVNSFIKVGQIWDHHMYFCHFFMILVALTTTIEIYVMFIFQKRDVDVDAMSDVVLLLIGGFPIFLPTVLSIILATGSQKLFRQGIIVKKMSAIETLACMDVLFVEKTGTLTPNRASVDKNLVEVFMEGVDKEYVIRLAARASRIENQDALDAAVIETLANPAEARIGIQEVDFIPLNSVEKRSVLTYIDSDGKWHRASKGAPEQILRLCQCKGDIRSRALKLIDRFAKYGFQSLAVAHQEIPEKNMESIGGPWHFVCLLPVFIPPKCDSHIAVKSARNLGINVKLLTGDQLAIAKETGRIIGVGTNIYPSSLVLGHFANEYMGGFSSENLAEMADGFSGVLPSDKYEIVKKFQLSKHICGMAGAGVNDVSALNKADVGIAFADASDSAKIASSVISCEPELSSITDAISVSRSIFWMMKSYMIYAIAIAVRNALGFMLIALIWKFDFSPIAILVIVFVNEGFMLTILKDHVKPSPIPESWCSKITLQAGVLLGVFLALTTVIFFWAVNDTNFFPGFCGIRSLRHNHNEMMTALYLQVCITGNSLLLLTRSRSSIFKERPGLHLCSGFIFAQVASTLVAVYSRWDFAMFSGIGWGWAGVVWISSLVTFFPLSMLAGHIMRFSCGRMRNIQLSM